MFGICEWDKLRQRIVRSSEYEYCSNYNELPYQDDTYTTAGDGWRKTALTPAGKLITVVSKNGRWMYLHDGSAGE